MRERFIRFMQGRYGGDQFGNFIVIVALVLLVIAFFIPSYLVKNIFHGIVVLLLIYTYVRMFSKNHEKYARQNQRYLKYCGKIKRVILKKKENAAQRKTHRIFRCPNCRQAIRVPKGKGKIAILCPRCDTEFIRRS